MNPPFIVCAANRHPTNGRIICGARHYDPIMRAQIDASEGYVSWMGCEQGFIDQFGKFYSREEAFIIARDNNQIKRRCGGDNECLFSESLY